MTATSASITTKDQPGSDWIDALLAAARRASGKAYAPYSRFHVGAAVMADDGRIFAGANIENASYGLTSCAERNAVFAAVASGRRAFSAIAVAGGPESVTSPCGACRQVIFEFGPDAKVVSCCDGDGLRGWSIDELLPGAFGPKSL